MFPVSLLLVVLICPPVLAYSDNFTEAYLLQEKLEKALVDDPDNLYEIQEKFALGDNPLIKCVPVTYVITETNDTQPVNCTNCTFGYNETFLWTSFDTNNVTGSLLFTWAKSGLRVFGFSDWATPCKFNATTDGIVLHLNVDKYPIIPDLENILLYILNVITEELKAYAYANGKVPSPEMIEGNRGYAQKWNEDDARAISQGEAIVIAGSIILAAFSFFLMIAIIPTVYNKLYKNKRSRKDYTYLYFWSSVPLLYVFVVCAFLYGLTQASATLIFYLNAMYIFMVTMFFALVAPFIGLYYYFYAQEDKYKMDNGIPCPLLCFCKCCLNAICCHCVNNGCAIFMTYGILVYFMYAFPAIIIAYYLFPSRTLVRLSFIQVAFLIIVLTITVFLYLMERMCLLCLLARTQTFVKDPEASTQELFNLVANEDKSEPSRHTSSATEEGVPLLQQPSEDRHNQHNETFEVPLLICWIAFKALVALFGVCIVFFLLVIVGMVVFTQSAEGSDRTDQFLSILPTILVNFIVWSFRAKLFHLGKTLKEVVIPSKENSATRYGTTSV